MRKKAHHQRVMTLDQISQELGITRERVRQIERDALIKLKKKLFAMGIPPENILPATYDEAKQ